MVVDSFSTSHGSLTVLFSMATIGSDGQLSEVIGFNSVVVSSTPVCLVWSGVWLRLTSNVGSVWLSDKVSNTKRFADSSDKVGIGGTEPSELGARVEDGKTVSSICISSEGVSAAFGFSESTGSFSILHIDVSELSVGSAEHGCGSLMLRDALVTSSTSSWDGGTAVGEDDSRAIELDSGSISELDGRVLGSSDVSEGVWIEFDFESLSQASEEVSDSASSKGVSGISVGKLVDSGFMVSMSEDNTDFAGEDCVVPSGVSLVVVDESSEGGLGDSAGSLVSMDLFSVELDSNVVEGAMVDNG